MLPRVLRFHRVAAAALLLLLVAGCCDLAILTDSLPDGVVGQPYSFQLEGDCGDRKWSLVSGTLPPGISLDQNGRLRGTPTLEGTYVFTIAVADDSTPPDMVSKGFSVKVTGPSFARGFRLR